MARGLVALALTVLLLGSGCAELTPGPDGPTGTDAVEVSLLSGTRGGETELYPPREGNDTAASFVIGTPDDSDPQPHYYYVTNRANDSRHLDVVVEDGETHLNGTVRIDPGETLRIHLAEPGDYRTTITVRTDDRVLSEVRIREYSSNFNCNVKWAFVALNGNGTVASSVGGTVAGCPGVDPG